MTAPDKLSSKQLKALTNANSTLNTAPTPYSAGGMTPSSSGVVNYNPFTQSGMLNVSTAAAAPSSLSTSQQQRGGSLHMSDGHGSGVTGSILMPPVLVALPPSGGSVTQSTASVKPAGGGASSPQARLDGSGAFGAIGPNAGSHHGSPISASPPPTSNNALQNRNINLMGGDGNFPNPDDEELKFDPDSDDEVITGQSKMEIANAAAKAAAQLNRSQQRSLVHELVDDDPVEDFDSSISDKDFFIVEDRNLALNPPAAAAAMMNHRNTLQPNMAIPFSQVHYSLDNNKNVSAMPSSSVGGGIRRKTQTGTTLERNTATAATNFSSNNNLHGGGGVLAFNTALDHPHLGSQQKLTTQLIPNNNAHQSPYQPSYIHHPQQQQQAFQVQQQSQQPGNTSNNKTTNPTTAQDVFQEQQNQGGQTSQPQLQQRGGQSRRHQSNSQQHMEPTNNLFICYLPYKMTDQQLLELVRQQVAIASASENALRGQTNQNNSQTSTNKEAPLSQATSVTLEGTQTSLHTAPSIAATNVPSPTAPQKEKENPNHPPAGAISAKIARHPDTNETKGFGFVLFASVEEAIRAKQALDGLVVGESKKLVVRYALPITDEAAPAQDDEVSENRNIYVKGLPPKWGSPDLRQFFETRFGPVEDAIVLLHRGESKCLGLVLFKEIADARKAVKEHGKAIIEDWPMPIQIRYSVPDTAKKRHETQKQQETTVNTTVGSNTNRGRGRGGVGSQQMGVGGRGHSTQASGVEGTYSQSMYPSGPLSPITPTGTAMAYMYDPQQQQQQQTYYQGGFQHQLPAGFSPYHPQAQSHFYTGPHSHGVPVPPQALYTDPYAQPTASATGIAYHQPHPFSQTTPMAPPPPPQALAAGAYATSTPSTTQSMTGLGSDLHRPMFSPPLSPYGPTGLGASSTYNSSTNSQQPQHQPQPTSQLPQSTHLVSAVHHAAAAAAAAKAAAAYYHQLGLPVPPNLHEAFNPQIFQQPQQQIPQQQVWIADTGASNTTPSSGNPATNVSNLNTNNSYTSSSGTTPPNGARSPQLRHNPYYSAPIGVSALGVGPMDLHTSSLSAIQMASPTTTGTSHTTPSSGTTAATGTSGGTRTNAIIHLAAQPATASTSDAVAAALGLQPTLSLSQGSGQSASVGNQSVGNNPLSPPPPPPSAVVRKPQGQQQQSPHQHSCRYCANGCGSVVVYGLPTSKEQSESAAAKLLAAYGPLLRCQGMANGVVIATFADKSAAMLAVQMLAHTVNRLALLDCSSTTK